MKFPALLLALSILVVNQAAVVKEPETRNSLIVGSVSPGDTLAHSQDYNRLPVVNAILTDDVNWRAGNTRSRITAVRALENGETQNATASIVAGGLGTNFVTVRLQTAAGRGYSYVLEIWTTNHASKLNISLSALCITLITIGYFSSSEV